MEGLFFILNNEGAVTRYVVMHCLTSNVDDVVCCTIRKRNTPLRVNEQAFVRSDYLTQLTAARLYAAHYAFLITSEYLRSRL